LSGRGLTPEQYREKWGLPIDYPMVAPSYARQRSELAKSMGLGRQRRTENAAPDARGGGRRRGAKSA
jgi:predicted transcriptional regulator